MSNSISPLRVFLVEDHFVVRQGLRNILEKHGVEVSGEADDAASAIELCYPSDTPNPNEPDVIILDLTLPNTTGMEAIQKILDRRPEAKIVVFSMRDNIHTIALAYKAGVLAYVTKDAGPNVLLTAIRHAENGESWVMPSIEGALALHMISKSGSKDPRDILTERELEIFLLLAKGMPTADIAVALGITDNTLSKRIFEIRHKLGAERTDFMRVALRYDLIRPE